MDTMEEVWNKIKWRDDTEQLIKNWFENEANESQRKELLGYYNVFTVANLKQMCREQHLQLTHCGEAPNKIELCYMLVRGKCYGNIDIELPSDSEDETNSHLQYGAYKQSLVNIIKHSKYYNDNLMEKFTSELEEIQRQVYKDFVAEKGIDNIEKFITNGSIDYEEVAFQFWLEKIKPTLP